MRMWSSPDERELEDQGPMPCSLSSFSARSLRLASMMSATIRLQYAESMITKKPFKTPVFGLP